MVGSMEHVIMKKFDFPQDSFYNNGMKKGISRRTFMKYAAAAAFSSTAILLDHEDADAQEHGLVSAREARHYRKLDKKVVQCSRCPNLCTLKPGERSFCRTRINKNGTLYTVAYGNPCAIHVDPIEKKPFFHFLPKTKVLSFAIAGCTFRCKFCQNWEISQFKPEETYNFSISPEEMVDLAERENIPSLSSTYSEPTAFYEYMFDVNEIARKRGLRTTMHSNGSINPEPLEELCENLDAANIDLKYFDDDTYHNISRGYLETVLETLETLMKKGVHLEITNLVVPTLNDSESMIGDMSRWIIEHLGADVPIHFSRFYPTYKLKNLPPTPVKTLEMARSIARGAGLRYVYIGNIPGHEGEHTYCPHCGKLIIERVGYEVRAQHLEKGKCKFCWTKIAGVWE
jgi:pyruvate formate lyase activating enzyme